MQLTTWPIWRQPSGLRLKVNKPRCFRIALDFCLCYPLALLAAQATANVIAGSGAGQLRGITFYLHSTAFLY